MKKLYKWKYVSQADSNAKMCSVLNELTGASDWVATAKSGSVYEYSSATSTFCGLSTFRQYESSTYMYPIGLYYDDEANFAMIINQTSTASIATDLMPTGCSTWLHDGTESYRLYTHQTNGLYGSSGSSLMPTKALLAPATYRVTDDDVRMMPDVLVSQNKYHANLGTEVLAQDGTVYTSIAYNWFVKASALEIIDL